ncbi:uncharacterized protein [Haliotis cracherodii]|uniref:uncharacterized protein n=1 Tax=Haliotis cracherodii TaxID=6455 RepID=UPI0039E925F3
MSGICASCQRKLSKVDPHKYCPSCIIKDGFSTCSWDKRCKECENLSSINFNLYLRALAKRAADQRYKQRRTSVGSLDSAPSTSGPWGGGSATPKKSVDKDPPQSTSVFDKSRDRSPADDTTRTTDLRQSVDRERHSTSPVTTGLGGDKDHEGTTVPSRSVSRSSNDDRDVVRDDSGHRSRSRLSRDDRSSASSRDSTRHEGVHRRRGRRRYDSDDNYDGDRSTSTVRDPSPRPHGDVQRSRREFLGVQRRSEDSDRTTTSSHFHIDPALIAQITAAVLASTASTKKDSTTPGVHGPSTSTPAPSSTLPQSTSTMDCDDSPPRPPKDIPKSCLLGYLTFYLSYHKTTTNRRVPALRAMAHDMDHNFASALPGQSFCKPPGRSRYPIYGMPFSSPMTRDLDWGLLFKKPAPSKILVEDRHLESMDTAVRHQLQPLAMLLTAIEALSVYFEEKEPQDEDGRTVPSVLTCMQRWISDVLAQSRYVSGQITTARRHGYIDCTDLPDCHGRSLLRAPWSSQQLFDGRTNNVLDKYSREAERDIIISASHNLSRRPPVSNAPRRRYRNEKVQRAFRRDVPRQPSRKRDSDRKGRQVSFSKYPRGGKVPAGEEVRSLPLPSPWLESPPVTLPLDELPVGGRLHHYAHKWVFLNDPYVQNILTTGYTPRLRSTPPLTSSPTFLIPPTDRLTEAIDLLVEKAAVLRLGTSAPSPGSLRRMILPNDFLVSIDLQDEYLHVPIASEFQKYLRFEYQGIHYQWAALPFGISTAPCIFTRIMKTVVEWLHRQAIRVAFYLNDGLQAHQFTEALQEELATTLSLLWYLGWIVNLQKSDLVPTRDLQYIGIRFQTGVNLVMVPQDRWDKIVSSVPRLLHAPAAVHTWQEVLGLLTSAQDLTRRGRLQLRLLQRLLYPHLEFPNLLVPLPAQLRCHLEWWLQPSNVCEGVFMSEPPFILHLFVDASLEGWGAHFGDDQAAGLWSPVEKVLHINCLEMEAVIRAVEFWKLRLRRKRLMIQSDNSSRPLRQQTGNDSVGGPSGPDI